MKQFWWVPVVLVVYSASAVLSKRANDLRPYSVFYLYALSLIPLWVIVARYSTNLLRDAILYDWLLLIQYPVFLILGTATGFSRLQWCGAGLAFVGLCLLRR